MPGVHIRYVDFHGLALNDTQIRVTQQESIFSQWQAETQRAEATSFAALSLAPLYKRPPFAWQVSSQ
jgi:hypothetical protein